MGCVSSEHVAYAAVAILFAWPGKQYRGHIAVYSGDSTAFSKCAAERRSDKYRSVLCTPYSMLYKHNLGTTTIQPSLRCLPTFILLVAPLPDQYRVTFPRKFLENIVSRWYLSSLIQSEI